jgi:SAM-dependent methyltransferase
MYRKICNLKLIKEAEEISEIAFGFMASKALFSALHAGIFTKLSEKPRYVAELAEEVGVPANRIQTLLTALTALGLVSSQGGLFENSPGAEAFLVEGAKYDFGNYLRLQIDRQMFPIMTGLEAVVTGETTTSPLIESYADWFSDPEEARLYSESQHAGSLGPGRSVARMLDLSEAKRLMDVGGGTGAFAIRLCEANPNLTATVLDFPNVVKLGEEYVQEAGLSDRISFIAGNALEDEWPDDQDVILMSYLFNGVPGEAIPDLTRRAFSSLRDGGHFLVHDFIVDDDRTGPPLAALWQLQHLAFTPAAKSLTPTWLTGLMEGVGFTRVQTHTLIPGMTRLMHGRKIKVT